jgi:hypothetical protein
MSNSEEHERKQNPPYIDPALIIDTRLSEIERQQREEKAEQKKHASSQRITNWLLTIFTGLLFFTSVASDVLMLRYVDLTKKSAEAAESAAQTATKTLDELKLGSSDTHALALAAKAQAASSEAIAGRALSQAVATNRLANEAGRQVEAAKDSLKVVRDNFQTDQRPYVMLSYFEPQIVTPGKKISVDLYWANYGKSPAINVRRRSEVFFGPDAIDRADKWFETEAPKAFLDDIGIIIPPGVPVDPKRTHFASISKDAVLTTKEFEFVVTHDFSVVIANRQVYTDGAGKTYWTDSCMARFVSGAIPFCLKHNEVH